MEYGLKFATCIPGRKGNFFVLLVTTFGSVTRCVMLWKTSVTGDDLCQVWGWHICFYLSLLVSKLETDCVVSCRPRPRFTMGCIAIRIPFYIDILRGILFFACILSRNAHKRSEYLYLWDVRCWYLTAVYSPSSRITKCSQVAFRWNVLFPSSG